MPRLLTAIAAGVTALTAVAVHHAAAVTISFGSASDYDNNFYERTNPADTTWASINGGVLQKGGQNSATIAIFNTTSTGGLNGSGGTGASVLNNDLFSNVTIQGDFAVPALLVGGTSFGIFTKVNATATSGYAAVFRLVGPGSADLRIWDSNDTNPTTGSLGLTPILNQNFTGIPANSFATGTFYTLRLEVVDVGSNVQFTGSIYTQGGTQIGNSITFTDTTSAAVGAGQVAFRFGSNTNDPVYYDNIVIIPEPMSFGIVGLGALGLLLRRRRR